ncbi:hypothetical protein B0H13DRAFT_1897892 [Mycena leptocephala]|nr:hypothetical protein B0H13DRAFT_1897892 [Mycena leptocephala]
MWISKADSGRLPGGVTWNLAGWNQYQFATSGQMPPLCHPAISLSNFGGSAVIFDSQYCIDNCNGNGNAKPSDGKEALGHLFTVERMGVKGHQHKSIHAQVKQVNPPKFKLRVVPSQFAKSIGYPSTRPEARGNDAERKIKVHRRVQCVQEPVTFNANEGRNPG